MCVREIEREIARESYSLPCCSLDHGASLHVCELLHAPLSLDNGTHLQRKVGVLVLLTNLKEIHLDINITSQGTFFKNTCKIVELVNKIRK